MTDTKPSRCYCGQVPPVRGCTAFEAMSTPVVTMPMPPELAHEMEVLGGKVFPLTAEPPAAEVFERVHLGDIPGHPGGNGLVRTVGGPLRAGQTAEFVRAMRRELQSTDVEHRVTLVSHSREWADRVLEALDPHERERVDVSVPEEVT